MEAKMDNGFWKGVIIAADCCCHVRLKEKTEVSIGFCNMYIVDDCGTRQDNLVLKQLPGTVNFVKVWNK